MAIFFSFRARNVIFVPMQMQVQQDTLPRSGLWVSLAEGHCSLCRDGHSVSRAGLQGGNAGPAGLELQFFNRNQATRFLMSPHFLNAGN